MGETMTRLLCLAPHPANPDRQHRVLLMKLHGHAEPTGRVVTFYEEVRKPHRGVKYVGVRCSKCKKITEYAVRER